MPANPYIIVPYSSDWPIEFRQIATEIRSALGPLALRIDHIGSTSVAGLSAKDVIDIQVTVADLHASGMLDAMAGAGFEIRPKVTHDHVPPGHSASASEWEKRFFREPPGRRIAHVHVRPAGKPNQRYALLFRDYLRAHPAAARAYEQVKQRLAPKLERLDYIEAKDPVCDLIIQAAEVWAGAGWSAGNSDA